MSLAAFWSDSDGGTTSTTMATVTGCSRIDPENQTNRPPAPTIPERMWNLFSLTIKQMAKKLPGVPIRKCFGSHSFCYQFCGSSFSYPPFSPSTFTGFCLLEWRWFSLAATSTATCDANLAPTPTTPQC